MVETVLVDRATEDLDQGADVVAFGDSFAVARPASPRSARSTRCAARRPRNPRSRPRRR
jgi:hypothetical protein